MKNSILINYLEVPVVVTLVEEGGKMNYEITYDAVDVKKIGLSEARFNKMISEELQEMANVFVKNAKKHYKKEIIEEYLEQHNSPKLHQE